MPGERNGGRPANLEMSQISQVKYRASMRADGVIAGRRSVSASGSGSDGSGSDTSRSSRRRLVGETGAAEPISPTSPSSSSIRRFKSSRAEGLARFKDVSEEEAYLKILDLLEQNDEFNSTSASSDDEASEVGEDDMNFCDSESSIDDDDSSTPDRELADWELEAAWMELQERRLPNIEVCKQILRTVTSLCASQKNVVHIPTPDPGARLVIVGDLHGHFEDLMHVLREHGEPQMGPGGVKYLFNGDFVDRGAWGPEVLLVIYCLKLRCPDAVFLNRGNHEDEQQNLKPDNGFVHSHCTRAFGSDAMRMYALCRRSFREIALCHVIANEIVVIHGGLPLDPNIKLEDINEIDRRRSVPMHHCSLLGYPRYQTVRAKKDLESNRGEKISKGMQGKLVDRVGKSNRATVRFTWGRQQEEAVVKIAGAPELEEDVEVYYSSEKERLRHRGNRLFVALLWSDPVSGRAQAGPSKRGAGSYFDEYITAEFLRLNKMKLMLRSHEKRQDGFSEEHRSAKSGLLAATIFSASNYPAGAGEPSGNAAAVVVLKCPSAEQSLASTIHGTSGWHTRYSTDAYGARFKMSAEMKEKFRSAQASRIGAVGPRARVLAKMRELIYVARPKLLTYWQRIDTAGTGVVPVEQWPAAMRSCVVPDDDFPWEWIAPTMLRQFRKTSNFNYAAYLAQYENTLSRKLANSWHSGVVLSLANGVQTKEQAEAAWATIDRNGDGQLSYQELRPLLKTSASSDVKVEEDRVYSVLARMDKDKTGYIDREEFVHAVVRSVEQKPLLAEVAASRNDQSALAKSFLRKSARKSTADSAEVLSIARSKKAIMLQLELSKWSEADIAQCWAATQGAIRALAATTGCVSSVFEVLDGDGDGKIDRGEFQEGLIQLLKGSELLLAFDQWEPLLWRLVDEDGSGFVSPSELNLAFSVRESLSI